MAPADPPASTAGAPAPHPVLVLFAHPALQHSRVNRRLLAALSPLAGVTVNDLYERYPQFDIDVAREQRLLDEHQVVVFHHPFFWYSTPALLKEWQDVVLSRGWAYGEGGTALRGKTLLSAITAGGGQESYRAEGFNHFTVRQLLAPIEQTARLCGMAYLPPFVVHGTHTLTDEAIEAHAADYARLVAALRDGLVRREGLADLPRLNEELDAVIALP